MMRILTNVRNKNEENEAKNKNPTGRQDQKALKKKMEEKDNFHVVKWSFSALLSFSLLFPNTS